MSLGVGGSIGFRKEVVPGTPETTVSVFYPSESFNVSNKSAHIERKSNISVLGDLPDVVGKLSPVFKFDTEVLASYPHVWYWALGAIASAQQAATTAYKHTITIPTTGVLPSLTCEADKVAIKAKQGGCMISKLDLSCAAGEAGKLKVEGLGLTNDDAPTFTSTLAYVGADQVLTFAGAKATIGGVDSALIDTISLSLDNQLEQKWGLKQSTTPVAVRRKTIPKVGGKATFIDFPVAEYTKLQAATAFALVLLFEGPIIASTYKQMLKITLPCVQWKDGFTPDIKADVITTDATFEAHFDTVTSSLITVEAQNTLTTL